MNYIFDYIDDCMQDSMRKQISLRRNEGRGLSINKVEGAVVLPMQFKEKILGGVIAGNGDFISNTGFHIGKEGVYSFAAESVTFNNKPSLYLGYFNSTWGHCFTDNFKLLWPFACEYGKDFFEKHDVELIYTSDPGFKFSENFKELLSLVGIDVEKLKRVDTVTRFDCLYVPEACFYTKGGEERFYTEEYVDIINKLTHDIVPIEVDKIYLTRTNLKVSRDIGEKDIEKVFKKLGYKIISPEGLSLRKQLGYIKGCKCLATTEGSISHNAVFMSRGTQIEIIRKVPFINEYQIALNEIKELNVTYIDAHLSIFVRNDVPAAGPFFIYVNDNLLNFAKRDEFHNTFSIKRFRNYVDTCAILPHLEQRVQLPFYYYAKASFEIERKKEELRRRLSRFSFLSPNIKKRIISLGKKLIK